MKAIRKMANRQTTATLIADFKTEYTSSVVELGVDPAIINRQFECTWILSEIMEQLILI